MLSQTGISMFSIRIRRLTKKEVSLVRNHKDRGFVSSVSGLLKASLFVHCPRLMGTQSPACFYCRSLSLGHLPSEKRSCFRLHILSKSLLWLNPQTCYVPVSRYFRHPIGAPFESIHGIGSDTVRHRWALNSFCVFSLLTGSHYEYAYRHLMLDCAHRTTS